MPRLGGFPESLPFDFDALFESKTSASGPEVVRTSLPPGPERAAVMAEIMAALQSDAGDVSAMAEELRGLMDGRNLTQLINSVVVPAMTSASVDAESLADGDRTATWAAKVEYLVGVALSVNPNGDADTPTGVSRRVTQLVSDIFKADQIRMMTEFIENSDGNDPERELLLQQLQLEYQADRMPGYAVHLEVVDAEVFGRHRSYYMSSLGFDPADVIRVTRLHTRSTSEALSAAMKAATDALNIGEPNPAVGAAMRKTIDAVTLWKPADIAAGTNVPLKEIIAMLDFFSTEYGCQPEFRAPGDRNKARTHPCIKLDDGTYLVPDPWALSAVIHHRLATEPKRDGFDPQKYFQHRQDAHERLVAAALEKVFGSSNVHSTQHYDLASGDHGEIDTLVCAEWPLVVEAKAIVLTDSGRRGAPHRVHKKLDDILGKALEQTDRALTYILDEDGRTFAPTQKGNPAQLLPEDVSGGTAVIVTFERIDPFASLGLAGRNVDRPTWVVSITDLLMVVDILTDSPAFHHYARIRAGMHAAQVCSFAEADALGAYLLSRLSILTSAAEDTRIFIGYSCEAINNFYTRQEIGLEAKKPTTGVSDDVASALAPLLKEPGWVGFVDSVMTADPSVWKKWKNFRRRHRRGGTFTLNEQTSFVVCAAAERSLLRTGDSLFIHIPS